MPPPDALNAMDTQTSPENVLAQFLYNRAKWTTCKKKDSSAEAEGLSTNFNCFLSGLLQEQKHTED